MLHEQGVLGSFARSLLGYNGDPSLLEVLGYIATLVALVILWRRASARSHKGRAHA